MSDYERPLIKPINPSMPCKGAYESAMHATADIAGVPVQKLIEKYGSPLFVLTERTIRHNIRKAKQAFETQYPKVHFAWSYKTNYLNRVCKIMHEEGSWAEVVSGFEYQKALRNGVSGNEIIFNGPNKTEQDLLSAIENESYIHIDNNDELYTLERLTDEKDMDVKVAIRINLKSGTGNDWERFGFNLESGQALDAIKKICDSKHLKLKGLHCHIGTFIQSVEPYKTSALKMAKFAYEIHEKLNQHIEYIDMGGGFASKNILKNVYGTESATTPSMSEYAEAITESLYEVPFAEKERPALILESGRALIDDAAVLLTTVTANKRSSKGRRYTVIDAGVNLLFTAFWYNHKITPASEHSAYYEDTTLYGPLCMNIDIVRESINLPLMNTGDHLVIHNVGAYNMTQWMQFINLRPAIVMIKENGEVEEIRRRETAADIDLSKD